MVFKWKDDHTPLILSLKKDQQCLWNTKAETYKNKVHRENALKEIVKELNIQDVTVEDIKLKIKTIRTRYSSELTKVNKSVKSGTGPADVYVPKLFWYKQADTFLHAVCIPRSSTGIAVPQRKRALSPQNHAEDDTEEGNDPDIEDTPEATGDSLPAVTNDGIVSNNETQLSQQSKRSRNTPSSSRRLNLPGISAVERAIDKLGTIASHNIETDNEFDHFCRSLAVQLKKMPLDRALICQTKLQNVMTEERMYLLTMEYAWSITIHLQLFHHSIPCTQAIVT
ncbi:hypothetical protein MML48_scaffold00007255 [Holotrichia oblita]|nr:hypothetical protein MML48_scaffold00007255 [Holotrichia oblita]